MMVNCPCCYASSALIHLKFITRIARKPTIKPMMKFSQLICRAESRLEPNFLKNFELFLISHCFSLRKICLPDFYFTLHEC